MSDLKGLNEALKQLREMRFPPTLKAWVGTTELELQWDLVCDRIRASYRKRPSVLRVREIFTDVLKDGAQEALIALECGEEEGITNILEHYGIKDDSYS